MTSALYTLLRGHRVAVLTGAGCSTESGIPDYRGPETARRARNPIQYNAFTKSGDTRERYWSRSMLGYGRVADAAPNRAHLALANLEAAGLVTGIITQNVDGLHQRGGSRNVVELHGNLATASCLDCGLSHSRATLQDMLVQLNPTWSAQPAEAAPDGDADAASARNFSMVDCQHCAGALKPDVVFFGENVPRERVDRAHGMLADASALLVVGTSLVVFSGYRFVREAHRRGIPIGMVNLTPTRAEAMVHCRIEMPAGEALASLTEQLMGDVG